MERLNNTNMESQSNNESANMDVIVSRAMAAVKEDQKQDIVHETPTSKHGLLKTAGALATAATIGLGGMSLAGCDQIPTAITDVQPSETKPSVTVTPTETTVKVTPTPTEAPTATPTPTEAPLTPEQQEEKDLQEKMNLAPDIEGAEKIIKEINGLKRVTYERDGEYIGEYKKEVTETDVNGNVTEVGGIALIGSEAEKILNEKLPTAKNGYLMPLAADISDLTTLENVNLAINSEGLLVDGPYEINISFGSETIDVSNIIPGKTSIVQSDSPMTGFNINQSSLNFNSKEVVKGKEMKFLTVLAKFKNGIETAKERLMGDKLGETNKPILEDYGAFFSDPGYCKQSFEDILTVDKVLDDGTVVEVPVFVSSK